MKTNNFLAVLTIFMLLVLNSCTSDNALIGAPGQDGVDGTDGVAGTASCLACHNTQHRDSITDAYNLSLHGSGTTFERGTQQLCARCHSNEGFVEIIQTGLALPRVAPEFPTRITCTTCHSDHDSFDFEKDGQDYAIRPKNDFTAFFLDPSIVIDLTGPSNLCVNCHQPRALVPEDADGDGSFAITSSRFGPHHGPQSAAFEGIQGYEIAGSIPYPPRASSEHRNQSSCVKCHMGKAGNDGDEEHPIVGTHTMNPGLSVCKECHPNATSFDINGQRTKIAGLLAQLEARLATKGIYDPNGDKAVTGDFPIDLVGAYWNRIFVVEDKSMGVHNRKYIEALLQNSIEYLDKN